MKRSASLLVLLGALITPGVHGSTQFSTKQFKTIRLIPVEDEKSEPLVKLTKDKQGNITFAQKQPTQIIDGKKYRVIVSDPAGLNAEPDKNKVVFNKTAFLANGAKSMFFLGAKEVGTEKEPFRFAKSQIGMNTKGEMVPLIASLSPASVRVNGAEGDTPISSAITNLTLLGVSPVFSTESPDVFLMIDTDKGSSLLANSDPLVDAAGMQTDAPPVALAASFTDIFAAVPGMGKAFGDEDGTDRGVAVMRRMPATLQVLDAATGADTPGGMSSTAKIDVETKAEGDAAVQFSFQKDEMTDVLTQASIKNQAALAWHPNTKRLYVGLDTRHDDEKAGGVLNLAVGRFEKASGAMMSNQLVLSPFVANPTKELFYGTETNEKNVTNKVVGYYFDHDSTEADAVNASDADRTLAIDLIRPLHTSTGHDYLIVAGRKNDQCLPVAGDLLFVHGGRGVYALPLRDTGTNAEVGSLAQVSAGGGVANFSNSPTAFNQMPTDEQSAIQVGNFLFAASLEDLFVVGDSVYACFGGRSSRLATDPSDVDRNPDPEVDTSTGVGIFHSTALYDESGSINGWTPFTRVMGSVDRVFGAGLDPMTGYFYYLTDSLNDDTKNPTSTPVFDPEMPDLNANNHSTVKVTQWGVTDSINNLSGVLGGNFGADAGGVHSLVAFDEFTPGFKRNHLTVLAALGRGKLALIQSGKQVNNMLVPETSFNTSGSSKNVFVFDNDPIKNLGPLSSLEFARSSISDRGWVFVGGLKGLAVLSKADGTGFDSDESDGLENFSSAASGFPGDGTSFIFKQLQPAKKNDFNCVRKLAALNDRLYVATEKKLFVINLDENTPAKFDGSNATSVSEVEITGLPEGTAISDMIILAGKFGEADFRALLATTKGLLKLVGNAQAGGQPTVSEVLIGSSSLGCVVQLEYLSREKGKPSSQGNLYVLAASFATCPTTGKIYRFAISALSSGEQLARPIQPNDGLLVDLNDFRGNFALDGSVVLHTRSKHFDDTNYLNLSSMNSLSMMTQLTALLDIDIEKNSLVSAPLREPASGAWLVPGDWGVRANI